MRHPLPLALLLLTTTALAQSTRPLPSASTPIQRTDPNSKLAHTQLLAKSKQGHIDLYFEGDSITRRWDATDYPALLDNFNKNFHGWNAADFAWGGDTTNNILWRLQNGELDNVNPKVIVLLAGTNNLNPRLPDASAQNIAAGIKPILDTLHQKAPAATIILTAIFPRADNPAHNPTISKINTLLATYASDTPDKKILFLNINNQLTDKDGHLLPNMLIPDNLHPTLQTYQLWADALHPLLTQLLGPPATTDLAPPPTGDPSAVTRPQRGATANPVPPPPAAKP